MEVSGRTSGTGIASRYTVQIADNFVDQSSGRFTSFRQPGGEFHNYRPSRRSSAVFHISCRSLWGRMVGGKYFRKQLHNHFESAATPR